MAVGQCRAPRAITELVVNYSRNHDTFTLLWSRIGGAATLATRGRILDYAVQKDGRKRPNANKAYTQNTDEETVKGVRYASCGKPMDGLTPVGNVYPGLKKRLVCGNSCPRLPRIWRGRMIRHQLEAWSLDTTV